MTEHIFIIIKDFNSFYDTGIYDILVTKILRINKYFQEHQLHVVKEILQPTLQMQFVDFSLILILRRQQLLIFLFVVSMIQRKQTIVVIKIESKYPRYIIQKYQGLKKCGDYFQIAQRHIPWTLNLMRFLT